MCRSRARGAHVDAPAAPRRGAAAARSHAKQVPKCHAQQAGPPMTLTLAHTVVNPPVRATKAKHDDTIDTQQARGNIKSLDRKLKRLEPPARSGSSARMRWAQDNHEAHHHSLEHQGGKEDHATHAQKTGASRKRIYCGNNALAHELTSGQAVVGKRRECFRKDVGAGACMLRYRLGGWMNSSRNVRPPIKSYMNNLCTMGTGQRQRARYRRR